MKNLSTIFITILFIVLLGLSTSVYSGKKQIVGWVEKVRIVPEGLKIKAKLDSGALNSSLHAARVEEVERQGREVGPL